MKNTLEHFAFFFIVANEVKCIKVGNGEGKKSLLSSREIHQGYDSMSDTDDKVIGLGLQLKIHLIYGTIFETRIPLYSLGAISYSNQRTHLKFL